MGESAQLPISARFLGMESGDSSWAGEVERKHFGPCKGGCGNLVDEENSDSRRNERVFLNSEDHVVMRSFPELSM